MLYVPVKFQKEKPQEELIERIEELRSKLENTPIGTNNQIVLWEISKNILSLIESLHKVDQHELACLILLRSLWERTIDFCYLAHSLFNEENLPQRYLGNSMVSEFKITLKSLKSGIESHHVNTKNIENVFQTVIQNWKIRPTYCMEALKAYLKKEDYDNFNLIIEKYLDSPIIVPNRELNTINNIIEVLEKYKKWRPNIKKVNGFKEFGSYVIRLLPLLDISHEMTIIDLENFHKTIYEMGNAAIHSTNTFSHRGKSIADESIYQHVLVIILMLNWGLNYVYLKLIPEKTSA